MPDPTAETPNERLVRALEGVAWKDSAGLCWCPGETEFAVANPGGEHTARCQEARAALAAAAAGAPTTERDDDHPERTCERCGGPNVTWTAPSPVWNAVMRGGSISGEEPVGIVCPTCFAILAGEAGVAFDWRLAPKAVLVELETVTPSGRVWNPESWLFEVAAAVPSTEPTDDRYADGYDDALEATWERIVCSVCGENHDADESVACDGCEPITFREWVERARRCREALEQIAEIPDPADAYISAVHTDLRSVQDMVDLARAVLEDTP